MPQPRRLSWKTAHRKNRASTTTSEPNNTYIQQLNPYKPSSSLRGSANAANNNSIQDGNFERNVMTRRERRLSTSGLGDSNIKNSSFDDLSLGMDDDLDNILSGIEDEGGDVAAKKPSRAPLNLPAEIDIENDLQITTSDAPETSARSAKSKIQIQTVDFGSSNVETHATDVNQRKGPLHLSESLALPEKPDPKLYKAGNSFIPESKDKTSDNTEAIKRTSAATHAHQDHPLIKSFLDELIEESIDPQTDAISDSKSKVIASSALIPQCKEPPQAFRDKSSKLDPIESIPKTVISDRPIDPGMPKNDATNIFGEVNHHNEADDTISTVTDQTDSPYIFTYKRSNDDDSVSQITSSIAPSLVPSVLKNIPRERGVSATNRFKNPTWIGSGNRTTKRGAVVAGTFGRDRNRYATRGNAMKSGVSSSSSYGTADSPHQEGNSNLDEIAYAINGSGLQRTRRASQDFDLRTIDSEKSGVSRRRSNYDSQSNVSTLGNGGVSTAGHSVVNGSISKASSSRSGGLVSGFAMLARKAERFFLPMSPKVTQRKKFDRSDSLEDLLLEEGAMTLPHLKSTDEKDDDFSRAVSSSSYGSHPSRSRGTRQKAQSPRMLRLSLAVLFTLTMYIIFGGNNRTNAKGSATEKRSFKLESHAKHQDARPQFGPINNSQMMDRTDSSVLKQDRYSDPGKSLSRLSGHEKEEIQIPAEFGNVADVDAGPFQRGIDVPFYWHVPRSGGGTISDILGSCLDLVLASDAGGSAEFAREESLRIVHSSRKLSFLNVDTYSPKGIQRAEELNLVTSGLADVVISPLLYDAVNLFTSTHKGRMFTILRHPIDRAASLFYFIQDTQWKRPETRNAKLADITIESFYELGLAENNWMTRFLTNRLTKAELSVEDLDLAKLVLKEKFLVGLMEKKTQSLDRFQKYFGWITSDKDCIQNKIEWSWPMKHHHAPVDEGSDAWVLIAGQNTFDIMLYEYAKELFSHQESLVSSN